MWRLRQDAANRAGTVRPNGKPRPPRSALYHFDAPTPKGISCFGWLMTAAGALGFLVCLAWFALSSAQLFHQNDRAGEQVLAAGVGLGFTLFFTWVWNGFRTLPDWRVALDVPLRTKIFAAAGAAGSATLAAGAVGWLLFSICARRLFLEWMERLGAAGVGKVQVLLSALGMALFFLLLWYVFQGLMELREWARAALAVILLGTVVLAAAAIVADQVALAVLLGNAGLTAVFSFLGGLAVLGLILEWATTTGRASAHFLADEL